MPEEQEACTPETVTNAESGELQRMALYGHLLLEGCSAHHVPHAVDPGRQLIVPCCHEDDYVHDDSSLHFVLGKVAVMGRTADQYTMRPGQEGVPWRVPSGLREARHPDGVRTRISSLAVG